MQNLEVKVLLKFRKLALLLEQSFSFLGFNSLAILVLTINKFTCKDTLTIILPVSLFPVLTIYRKLVFPSLEIKIFHSIIRIIRYNKTLHDNPIYPGASASDRCLVSDMRVSPRIYSMARKSGLRVHN